MYPQGEYPVDPQRTPPVDPGDQQLFSELYHGGQSGPDNADLDAEIEAQRKKDAIIAANTGVAVSAAGGAGAAASVILAGQSGAVAGGAGAGGAAGASGGALASGGTAALVKGGIGTKFLVGAIAGAVVVSGVVVVGVVVVNRDRVGNDAAPIEQAALDKSIEKFDFENTTFTDESGNPYEFTDGRYAPPDVPEDRGEGYHLTGTEYADVDGDSDLDAATLIEWRPNAGSVTYTVNLWLWEGDKAEQVEYPVTTGYQGEVKNLKAVKGGFTVEMTERPPSPSGNDPEITTVALGFKDGYPVQTKPLGAVDRCPEFPDYPATGPYKDVIPKVAPSDDAPGIGKAEDLKGIYAVWTDRTQIYQPDNWMLARVERTDGSTSCGWIPTDSAY